MKTSFIYIFLFLVATSVQLKGQVELDQFFKKEYTKKLKKNDVVGMSIGIIDSGMVVHKQNFGYSNLEKRIETTSKTPYKIGSISKVFTGIAILKLHEYGKINYNRSIKDYLPELDIKSRFNDENTLLIKDLLCHSAGMPSDMINGMFSSDPKDFDWVVEKINQQYMTAPPKYEFSYSNLGYGLLGELIARISGQTYVDFMKNEIFLPMGLDETYVFDGEEQLSKAYIKGELYKPDRIRDQAAGSVVSTIDDMLEFLQFFMNEGKVNDKQFLSKESMNVLETNFLEGNTLENSFGYSFGLFLHPCEVIEGDMTLKDTLIEHGGDTNAFHAKFGYLKHQKIGAVTLTNSKRGGAVNSVIGLLNSYLKETQSASFKRIYEPLESIETSLNDPLTEEELKGRYAIVNFLFDVDNKEKVKAKLAGQKIVLKQKENENTYGLVAKLFGFIPIPVKTVEFVFFEHEHDIYVAQKDVKGESYSILAKKTKEYTLHQNWDQYLGEYEVIDGIKSNFEELELNGNILLSKKDDLLLLNFPKNYMIESVFLNGEAQDMAYGLGIGRNTGYSLTILENGNLSYMGYELKRVTP